MAPARLQPDPQAVFIARRVPPHPRVQAQRWPGPGPDGTDRRTRRDVHRGERNREWRGRSARAPRPASGRGAVNRRADQLRAIFAHRAARFRTAETVCRRVIAAGPGGTRAWIDYAWTRRLAASVRAEIDEWWSGPLPSAPLVRKPRGREGFSAWPSRPAETLSLRLRIRGARGGRLGDAARRLRKTRGLKKRALPPRTTGGGPSTALRMSSG